MRLRGHVHHHEVLKVFDNGKPRKNPKIEDWSEEVDVLSFVALPSGELKAIVADIGGDVRAVSLNEGHRYGTRMSGQWLTVEP